MALHFQSVVCELPSTMGGQPCQVSTGEDHEVVDLQCAQFPQSAPHLEQCLPSTIAVYCYGAYTVSRFPETDHQKRHSFRATHQGPHYFYLFSFLFFLFGLSIMGGASKTAHPRIHISEAAQAVGSSYLSLYLRRQILLSGQLVRVRLPVGRSCCATCISGTGLTAATHWSHAMFRGA